MEPHRSSFISTFSFLLVLTAVSVVSPHCEGEPSSISSFNLCFNKLDYSSRLLFILLLKIIVHNNIMISYSLTCF